MDLTFLPAVINDDPTPESIVEMATAEIRMMDIALRVAGNIFIRCRLAESQNWRCCWCGQACRPESNYRNSATIEHVHPRSLGGGDEWDNYAMACARCNHKRGSRSVEDFLEGRVKEKDSASAIEKRRRVRAVARYVKRVKLMKERNWVRHDSTAIDPQEWLASLNLPCEKSRAKVAAAIKG